MQNKKGLSDVITNVLIILLVLIAIGIIASFVIPMVRNAGNQAQTVQDCLNVKVTPVSCKLTTNGVIGSNITYSINRASGLCNVKDVKLIFEKQDGSTDVRSFNSTRVGSFVELDTAVETLLVANYTPKSFSFAVILNGSTSACTETAKIACTTG